MKTIFSLISLLAFQSLFAETIRTVIKSKETNIREIVRSGRVPEGKGFYLRKKLLLEEGDIIEFDSNALLDKPYTGEAIPDLKKSRAAYFGPIKIIKAKSLKRRKVKKFNKGRRGLYVYRFSVDLAPFLRPKWDRSLKSGQDYIKSNVEWNKVSTKGFWTASAYESLTQYGQTLVNETPKDVVEFCPKYFNLGEHKRKLFWIHLFSSIAKRESAFDPDVANDESLFSPGLNAISRGLLQISLSSTKATAYRDAGCKADIVDDLVNPEGNLRCGVAIFERWAQKDQCISCQNKEGKWRGAARYWSTLRTPYEVSCSVCSSGKANVGKKDKIIKELKAVRFCH